MARTKRPRVRLSEEELNRRARIALFWTVGITLSLYLIPYGNYVAYPLMLISTLVHELGHGVAAVLVGGEFDHFVMHWNGAGTAYTAVSGAGADAFVSAGGLCGPAVGAAACLMMARRPKSARITLIVFGAALLLADILVVRNGLGIAFTTTLAVVMLVIAVYASEWLSQLSLVFLGVQLGLSAFSRYEYLFMESAGPGLPSDSKQMEMALGLPYWFWGGLCAAFSLAMLGFGAFMLLRSPDGRPRRKKTSKPAF